MKKLVVGWLLAAVSAAAGTVGAAVVTNEWRVAFDVAFTGKGAPVCRLNYRYVNDPVSPKARLSSNLLEVNMTGRTRFFGGTVRGFTGLAWVQSHHFGLTAPAPGEKLHVEIVKHGDTMTVWQPAGGERRIFSRAYVSKDIWLKDVEFQDGPFEISGLVIEPYAGGEDVKPKLLRLPLPEAGRRVRFSCRPGYYPSQAELRFLDGERAVARWELSSFSQDFNLTEEEEQKYIDNGVPLLRKVKSSVRKTWLDSGLDVVRSRADRRRVFSRTRLAGRYTDKQIADALQHPERFGEPASDHDFTFELRRGADGLELWGEGSYLYPFPTGGVTSVELAVSSFGTVKRLPDAREADDPSTLALDVGRPFDTSHCSAKLGSFSLECNGYLSREPHDALPDSFLRRVPAATYTGAVVRCRVTGAATNTCRVTARLTNFRCPSTAGRSREAMTQDMVQLPKKDGEYVVTFRLDPGRIQDLVHDHPDRFLDFEVLGGTETGGRVWSQGCYTPEKEPSGVTVLSAALVRAPASLHVANGARGNVFVAGETASVTARVTAAAAGTYVLGWRVKDLDGKMVESGRVPLGLKAGETVSRTLAFKTRDVGWYRLDVALADAKGTRLVRFPDGAFAIIAPDDRKAGYESPYYTWGTQVHATTNEFRARADFLKKIGVRRTQLVKFTEADAKPWGLTLGEAYNIHPKNGSDAERQADYERQVREIMEKWPHVSSALILHERGGGPRPLELWGGKTELDAKDLARQKKNTADAIWRARIWRKVAPQVRLKFGNSGDSLGLMGDYFRGGVPLDLIDVIGEESVGQAMTPERSTGMAMRNLKDLAESYGCKAPVEPCYEWKSRVRRHFSGNLRKQAAWFARDALIALAWGARQLTVNTTSEPANSYFDTCWGDGAFTREPLCQPFPNIVATANLTRMLDCCTFSRLVPTGSKTAYCLEFRGADGRYVYACWTARGVVEAAFDSKAKHLAVTDLYGREVRRDPGSSFETAISEEPVYLTADGPLASVDATGARTYPWEEHPEMAKRQTLSAFDSTALCELDVTTNKFTTLGTKTFKWSRPGAFAFADAKDGGKACLSLTLKPDETATPLTLAYGFVRLKEPVAVPEEATTIGLDVKGNSSWSKVLFELKDANGCTWVHTGYAFQYFDWSDTMSLNYEGWHPLQMMIRPESPAKCASIGSDMGQWRGRKKIAYPVKITAVGFICRHWSFDLLNWVRPDSDEIRFRNIFAY